MEPVQLIPWGFLLVAVLSAFSCLGRADFNIVFGLVSYYIWRIDTTLIKENIKRLLYINGAAIAANLLWFLFVGLTWSRKATRDEHIWKGLKKAHSVALFFSFLTLVVEAGLVLLLYNYFQAKSAAVEAGSRQQMAPPQGAYDMRQGGQPSGSDQYYGREGYGDGQGAFQQGAMRVSAV